MILHMVTYCQYSHPYVDFNMSFVIYKSETLGSCFRGLVRTAPNRGPPVLVRLGLFCWSSAVARFSRARASWDSWRSARGYRAHRSRMGPVQAGGARVVKAPGESARMSWMSWKRRVGSKIASTQVGSKIGLAPAFRCTNHVQPLPNEEDTNQLRGESMMGSWWSAARLKLSWVWVQMDDVDDEGKEGTVLGSLGSKREDSERSISWVVHSTRKARSSEKE